MTASNAPLIAFVDGDDYVSSRYLEALDALLESYDADMSCCGYTKKYFGLIAALDDSPSSVAKTLEQSKCSGSAQAMRQIVLGEINFAFWSKLMTRELAESCPFPEGMVYEDIWNLGLVVDKAERIAYSSASLYCYVSRDNSITRARPKPLDRLWQFREALEAFEMRYAQCLGIEHACDDGPYCPHLVHRLCGQCATLKNSICDAEQRSSLEAMLRDELTATYRLARQHGISLVHPQMIRSLLQLHVPVLHDVALAAYRWFSGS